MPNVHLLFMKLLKNVKKVQFLVQREHDVQIIKKGNWSYTKLTH